MSHPRYEEWIFSRESLPEVQQRALEDHLEECPECARLHAAMDEVEDVLADAAVTRPQPGFVHRWQAVLERDQARQGARQIYTALGLVAAGTLAVATLLGIYGWQLISSPAQIANQLLFNLNFTITGARGLPTLARLGLNLMDGLHVGWALLFTAALGGMGLLWIYLTYRFTWQEVPNGG